MIKTLFFSLLFSSLALADYIGGGGIQSLSQLPLCGVDGEYVGQVSGVMTCATPSGGGNFTGAASSVAHDLVGFADTSGTAGEDSGILASAVVTKTGTQTLTNKTLTSPVIGTIVNTGTLTLPTSTDTMVGRATTDTLTNKTLTSPTINAGSFGTSITASYATATTVPYLDASKNLVSSAVTPTQLGYVDATSSIQTQLNGKLPTTGVGLIEQLDGQVVAPGNSTFYPRGYAWYAGTINSIYLCTTGGSDVVAVKINGTSVTGLSAVTVDSTTNCKTTNASGANTFSIGDQITVVTSSDSSGANLQFSIKVTR